jgi:glycyl-tRNA synthetase beta chain
VPDPDDEGQPEVLPAAGRHGKLTHKFLIVSNIHPADPSAVIGGNERVVRPRLADAKFFFDQDRKKTWPAACRAWPRWSTTASWAPRASAPSACADRHAIVSQLRLATVHGGGKDDSTLDSKASRPRCWPRPTC